MGGVSEEAVGRRARGLDRAFEILEFLRRQRKPMRPNEIAQQMGMPRSTIYELIHLMVRHEIVEPWDDDGRVFLGRKLYYLGMSYAEEFDLMRESDRLLERLVAETRETAQMCMLDGNKYTVALMREGSRPFRISSDVGEPVPLPWTASGRLLVSHMSDEEILAFIPPEDFRLPTGAMLDPQDFLAQVRQAARDGYFSFNSIVETFTHCFAIPVGDERGHCVATLCLVTPREDGVRNHDHYVRCLQAAARDLTAALGGRVGRNEQDNASERRA
jgi:DNA-binding IclR family transcriptional regulator